MTSHSEAEKFYICPPDVEGDVCTPPQKASGEYVNIRLGEDVLLETLKGEAEHFISK